MFLELLKNQILFNICFLNLIMVKDYEKYDSSIPYEMYVEKIMNYKHIISDFDGTLVVLEIDWQEVVDAVNDYMKNELNIPEKIESFWHLTFKYPSLYLKHKRKFDSFIKEQEDIVIKEKKWKKINLNLWKILEKKKFSILSNNMSSTIENIMVEENLIPSLIIGRDRVSIPKPEVEGIKLIMRTFKLKKEDVIMIGDTKWDRLTAERAGISYMGVADRDV